MADKDVKRKLIAIMSSDVVGYSRLMGEDEASTVRTIESYRNTIFALVQQHHGRVVDSPGDNILSEFASVVDAVQCAVEIQYVVKAKNAGIKETRKMRFRIGINLGDVIEEGDRLYGDGVNIAARLEGLADPGGICISGSAYEQIESKLALGYENLGEHTVKNISRPVKVYRIPIESETGTESSKGTSLGLKRFSRMGIVLLVCLFIVYGSMTLWKFMVKEAPQISEVKETVAVSSSDEPASPIEKKPSIAVLPFVNMSGDPEQEYFSDGLTEELLNGLAKYPGLIVKARTSSFYFKNKNVNIQEIGDVLNVTHIVEGSVRKSGNRVRVTAQLIATDEDVHIWSERYDRELTDVFAVQDDITTAILAALNLHLLPVEKSIPTANMEAFKAYQTSYFHFSRFQLDEAVDSLEKAISIDPNYSDAYGLLAHTHNNYIWFHLSSIEEKLPIIRAYADKALAIDPSQSMALSVNACLGFFVDRKYQNVINELNDLIRKYPNNEDILYIYGNILPAVGRTELALEVYDRIAEIDPLSPLIYFAQGWELMRNERFDDARHSFKRMEALGMHEPMFLAGLAFYEGDVQALETQLDLGQSNWGSFKSSYPYYKAVLSYLKGDLKKVAGVQNTTEPDEKYYDKINIALLKGDLDLALDYYSKSLYSKESYGTIRDIQAPALFSILFPEYRSHPKYQQMLKDVGLDDESISKLKIPALPF